MVDVRMYDSVDDMFADIRRAEEEAMKRAVSFQHALTQESETCYTMRLEPEYGDPLLICSEFPSYAELKANEIRLGASEEEADYGDTTLRESRTRGHMFGRHYSVIEPEGEWGSAHIATLIPITKETFEFFKERGWVL